MRSRIIITGGTVLLLALLAGCSTHQTAADFQPVWEKLVVSVADFDDQQPTGVAVSRSGRTFVAFPWWNKRPDMAVGELGSDGSLAPYPNAFWNDWSGTPGSEALNNIVCAQALWIDRDDNLWILDAGNPRKQGGVVLAGPKLIKVDLADDSIAQVYYFDHHRDLRAWSFLSDVRVDLDRRVAYMTDTGRGGIFVFDLKQRTAHNALLDHPSTRAEDGVVPKVGGEKWAHWLGFTPKAGVAGIELSADGRWLYYHAISGRTLYRVPTDVLREPRLASTQAAARVENLGDTGSAIDGMCFGPDGSLYMTAIERDAIYVRRPGGAIEPFVADARLQWPDSICAGPDGYLYFTTSMRHLHAPYRLVESRTQPYHLMRASIPKVAAAIAARDDAARALALAESAAMQADEAAALTKRKHDAALRLRDAADAVDQSAARAERVAAAQRDAQAQREADLRTAAEAQTSAMAQAQEAAATSQRIAGEADEAARLAEEAARIAQQRAEEAATKLAQANAARMRANLTQEEANAAQQAWELARGEADAALRAAKLAGQRAAAQRAAAAKARTDADAAMADATRQAELAVAAIDRARRARLFVETADRLAWEAENAELLRHGVNTATVEVPTGP